MQEIFKKIIEQIKELAVQEDSPIYEGDKEIDNFIRCNEAVEIVERAATEYNNGWIPCSEPPKTSDYILLSFSNFSLPIVGRYEENEEGGAYYIGDEDKTCVSQDIFVNAWQYLPELYQSKGE